jgi:signal peptidase I
VHGVEEPAGSGHPTVTEPGPGAPGADDPGLWPNPAVGARRRRRSGTRQAIEWVVLIGAALAIALLLRTFLFQAFYIPSASMEPTLNIDDRVLVNKLSYKLHDVHRGDIVVFEKPPQETSDIDDLVKRVIGLPGETVEGRDGHVYVDGKLLRESYLDEAVVTSNFAAVTVPANSLWVMGDNRPASRDSRYFGPIRESTVVGRVFLRIWPPSRVGFL